MINDKGLEIIIKQVALMNQIDPNVVDLVINNCYKFIRETFKEVKETDEPKVIMLGGYGKFIPSESKLRKFRKKKQDDINRRE